MSPSLRASRPAGRRQPADRTRFVAVGLVLALLLTVAGLVHQSGPAAAATLPLSQGRTATASSSQSAGTAAANAVDGNLGTRWSSAFSDPQWLQVDLGASATITQVTLNWEHAYGKAFQIQTSPDAVTWTSVYSTTTGTGGVQNLTVSGTGRYVRMYGTARGTGYGYSLWEMQVFGTAGSGGGTSTCGTTDVALNRPATASSMQSSGTAAANAVDGNLGTRWSSAFSDPQWLQVDLGSAQSICGVTLNWENAYGKAFQIQTSPDGATWTSIYATAAGTGGVQKLTVSGPAGTCGCTAPPAPPRTAIRCGSWAFSPPAPQSRGASCTSPAPRATGS